MSFLEKHTKDCKEVTKRTLKFCVEVCLVFVAVGIIIYSLGVFNRYRILSNTDLIKPGVSYPQDGDFSTVVLGEETEAKVVFDEDKNFHKSENYKTKLITFAGNTILPTEENLQLKIDDVRSELLTTRNQKEIKLYVSWKTNKTAVSELKYGKNIEQGGKSYKEDKFGYIHSTILSPLDAASAYTYRIDGRDKWGNKVQSQQFAFYTGAPNVSLLDLLLGAFRDVFGWAMKK
ncbi:MAG: hypothetical protein U9O20_03225 [Patescibacteria group bacterium]|nr:hypothetical protein [Patescibacteria group bacterium]